MKKLVFSMALLLVASVSFAQKDNVREAKSLAESSTPDFAKAQQLIDEALVNPETKDDANTWNVAGLIQKRINEEESKKIYLRQPFDTVAYYNSVYKMFNYFLKCDELAQVPNEKGKVKNKFRKTNAATMLASRPMLSEGGGYFFNTRDTKNAFNLMSMYVDVANAPMLVEENLAQTDTLFSTFAYYTALAAYQNKDYDNVTKYVKYVLDDKEFGKDGYELCSETYKALKDTANWLVSIKEAIQKYPEHMYFVVSLVDHYTTLDQLDEAEKIANEFVAQKPGDPQALYIQGYIYTLLKKYENAQASLKKAIELDPANANYYSWMGHTYFYEAQDVIKASESIEIGDPKYLEQQEKIKTLYNEAMPFYKKARELGPDDKSLWQNLYTIYYALNMGPELEEIESALGY